MEFDYGRRGSVGRGRTAQRPYALYLFRAAGSAGGQLP
jgi:hypothetical protein